MSDFQTVSVSRLYRVIADQIAQKIRAGEFVAGSRLPAERELAERFGVSRPSIREALIALEIEGYVDVRVGTGVFVQPLHEPRGDASDGGAADDFGPFDLLETRLIIEPECAALSAVHATQAQLDTVVAVHRAMTLSSPANHDRAFHDAIGAGCGNAALAATVSHLWDLAEASPIYARLDAHFVTTTAWETAYQEHGRILAALVARDPIRARHAMRAHLDGILARLREDFGNSISF